MGMWKVRPAESLNLAKLLFQKRVSDAFGIPSAAVQHAKSNNERGSADEKSFRIITQCVDGDVTARCGGGGG